MKHYNKYKDNDKAGKISKIKKDLRRSGVKPSKQKGQNFLLDESVLEGIVTFANPDFSEKVIEIGPGLGALTKYLSPAKDLTLIELEQEFCAPLQAKYPHVKIINQDVRNVDFSKIGQNLTVFGNIPYVYSTDIIFCLIEHRQSVKKAVLLMQEEFAKRLCAAPGGRYFGVLSVAVQLWANVKLGFTVKGDAFHPPTKVSSQVVELEFLKTPRYDVKDYQNFRKVVQASFMQRRKKLSNSLKGSGFFVDIDLNQALEEAEIDGSRRAETLSIFEFVKLAEIILGKKNHGKNP